MDILALRRCSLTLPPNNPCLNHTLLVPQLQPLITPDYTAFATMLDLIDVAHSFAFVPCAVFVAVAHERVDGGRYGDHDGEEDFETGPEGVTALNARVFALDYTDYADCDEKEADAEEEKKAKMSRSRGQSG